MGRRTRGTGADQAGRGKGCHTARHVDDLLEAMLFQDTGRQARTMSRVADDMNRSVFRYLSMAFSGIRHSHVNGAFDMERFILKLPADVEDEGFGLILRKRV